MRALGVPEVLPAGSGLSQQRSAEESWVCEETHLLYDPRTSPVYEMKVETLSRIDFDSSAGSGEDVTIVPGTMLILRLLASSWYRDTYVSARAACWANVVSFGTQPVK